jgi:hypothetical protein
MKHSLAGTVIACLLCTLLTHCDVSNHRPGTQAVIPESDKVVLFSCATWSDVRFNHEQHSTRYNGMCVKCHDHQTIAGQTHWYCRSCHTAGSDVEKLCDPVAQHGCIMTQCYNCHETKGANPGQSCEDCHVGGIRNSDSGGGTDTGGGGTDNGGGTDTGGGDTDTGGDDDDSGGGDTGPTGSFSASYAGSIPAKSDVGHIQITIPKAGRLVIDVDAWEGCGNKPAIPTDLFNDGASNNKLKANIYLFNQSGTCVGSSTGSYPACDNDGDCAPGAHDTRTGQSPFLSMDIGRGTYVLAIGSYPLSQADAWAQNNSDGSSWTDYDSYHQITLYNRYRVKVNFQAQ